MWTAHCPRPSLLSLLALHMPYLAICLSVLQHANADDVTKQMAKRQAGKVQGTDADLRRMTTAQAKERLRCVVAAVESVGLLYFSCP